MGYVYDGMYRAIDGIKKLFKDKKKFWEPYINIIKDRWDTQFPQEIYAAAYWLNLAFQYDPSTSSKRQEVHGALTDVIEMRVSTSRHKLVDELKLFRERVGTFGKLLALETSKTTQPDEWWKLWGGCAPTLQKFAIRILSQTASSSGYEEPPCLDYEELEAVLYEEGAYPINEGSSHHVQGGCDDDDDDDDEEEEEEEDEDEDDDEDGGGGGGFGVDDDIDFNYVL
uniref:HAT C-terminal dimerisation domain-containing protein n=1 Tax=Fagus sylvatica TaxID=28930 RepID=A0A2N9FBX5_FAGSY